MDSAMSVYSNSSIFREIGNKEPKLAVIVDHLKTKQNDVFALEKTHRTVFSL